MNWFLWPGDRLCDVLGLREAGDRQGFRTFANIIIWGVVIVGTAIFVGTSFPG
ncbi:MAG TPA: hypothetical protein HPQ04_07215 [Rhodospirillaceae bacterium]|nr:hypothetical protein [Rhodospirillaceae bacterium]